MRERDPEHARTPKDTDMPTIVTVRTTESNVTKNTKAFDEAAAYSEAFTRLRDSTVTKPAEKTVTRSLLNHRTKWDGRQQTFTIFREGYEAYLWGTGQSYICKADFRKAYVANDSNYPIMRAKYGVSLAQIKSDAEAQYGMLKGAYKEGREILKRFTTLKNSADGIRVWHAMLQWYQYGGSVSQAMGNLHGKLSEPFTDKYPGGITAYVTMISNVYAEMEEVIQDHPGCDESVPVDGSRKTFLLHKFVRSQYHASVYDIHLQCEHTGLPFERFVELIRNKFASEDASDMKAATRRARTAQTGSDIDPETLAVVAMLAQTNPLYLSDQLLKLMKSMNLDFTREFLDKRNQITKDQKTPQKTPPVTTQPLPRQYSAAGKRCHHSRIDQYT
jgi:hypothetical protein